MQKQVTDDEKLRNIEKVWKLVDVMRNARGPRAERVKNMLDGPIGLEYFTAPATAREDYHGCFAGGLCAHSLRLTMNLYSLSKALCPGRYEPSTLAFVGLFAHLGKVGYGSDTPLFKPNPDLWQREKRGILYTYNDEEVEFMPTSERSLYLLQLHDIRVQPEEYVAIKLCGGPYDEANANFRMKEPGLALLTHWADRWAVEEDKAAQAG